MGSNPVDFPHKLYYAPQIQLVSLPDFFLNINVQTKKIAPNDAKTIRAINFQSVFGLSGSVPGFVGSSGGRVSLSYVLGETMPQKLYLSNPAGAMSAAVDCNLDRKV